MASRNAARVGRGEQWLARALAGLVLLVAAVSLVMARETREPYPGLIMPRFGHVLGDVSTARTTSVDIEVAFADGSAETMAPDELVPISVAPMRVVRENFFVGLDQEGRWKRGAPAPAREVVLHGYARGSAPGADVERARDPRTLAWLRQRMTTVFPEREATRLTFTWRRTTRQVPEGTVLDAERRKRIEVDL